MTRLFPILEISGRRGEAMPLRAHRSRRAPRRFGGGPSKPLCLHFFVALWPLALASAAAANTFTAASCSSTDIQAAINSAVAGDTVVVPNGTCAWTSGVTINGKGIKVQGAGAG